MEEDRNIKWVYSNCSDKYIGYLDTNYDCGAMGHKTPLLKEYSKPTCSDIDDDVDDNDGIPDDYDNDGIPYEEEEEEDVYMRCGPASPNYSTGQGAFRQEYIFPCLDCGMFEWSAWSTSSQGRLKRVRGNNTIVAGSYQEAERPEGVNVSLVGGNGNNTGNVYVTNSEGYHGPVCDTWWDNNDALVVCKELGFIGGTAKEDSYFGNGDKPFAMDNVQCSGSETSIVQCKYRHYAYCGVEYAAGVVCY